MFCIINGSLYNLDDIRKVKSSNLGYTNEHGKIVWTPRIVIVFKSGESDTIDNMTFDDFMKEFTNEEMRVK